MFANLFSYFNCCNLSEHCQFFRVQVKQICVKVTSLSLVISVILLDLQICLVRNMRIIVSLFVVLE
jgi:hypothetical protein